MQINLHMMSNNSWNKLEIRIIPQKVTDWELPIGNWLERKKCCLKDFLIDKILFELYFENHLTKQTYKNNADAKNNFLPLVNFKHNAKCVTWIFNRAVSNGKKTRVKNTSSEEDVYSSVFAFQNSKYITDRNIINRKERNLRILHVFSKFISLIWIKVYVLMIDESRNSLK